MSYADLKEHYRQLLVLRIVVLQTMLFKLGVNNADVEKKLPTS